MFFSVPAIYIYVVMYCDYYRVAISDVIHVYLDYILRHFQAKLYMKKGIASLVGIQYTYI